MMGEDSKELDKESPFLSTAGENGHQAELEAAAEEQSLERDTSDDAPFTSVDSEDGRVATFSALLEDPDDQLVFRRGKGVRKLKMDKKMWNEFKPYWEQENPDLADPLDKKRAQDAMTKAYSITYSESEASMRKQHKSVIGLPVISPYNTPTHIWMKFMMWFDLTYTAILVPMTVGFGFRAFNLSRGALSNFLLTIDSLAGVFFLVSLYLGFHVGFIAQHNLNQHVIMNGQAVAKYYTQHGTFVVDLISSFVSVLQIIGFVVVAVLGTAIHANNALQWTLAALQILRMVRIALLVRVVQNLIIRCSKQSRPGRILSAPVLYVLLIAYLLFFVVNFTAAVWFYVAWWYADYNHVNWVSTEIGGSEGCHMVNFIWQQQESLSGTLPPECAEEGAVPSLSFSYAYMLSIYWSVTTMTTVGYGDVSPTNIGEMVVGLTVMFLGIMSFAILIGSMQDIFASASAASEHATALRSKMSQVDYWISERKLPEATQSKIRRFFNDAWLESTEVAQKQAVFYELPSQLQGLVATDVMLETISQTRLLQNASIPKEAITWLASRLRPLSVPIGMDIASQGDRANKLWVLESGLMVAVFGGKVERVEAAPAVISKGTILQNLDSHFETMRCGFQAMTPCSLWELSLQDLFNFGVLFPKSLEKVQQAAAEELLQCAGIMTTSGEIDTEGVKEMMQETTPEMPDSPFAMSPGGVSAVASVVTPGEMEVMGFGAVDGVSLVNIAIAVSDKEVKAELEELKRTDSSFQASKSGPMLPGGASQPLDGDNEDSQQLPNAAATQKLTSAVQELLSRVRLIDARLSGMEQSLSRGGAANGMPSGMAQPPVMGRTQTPAMGRPQSSGKSNLGPA